MTKSCYGQTKQSLYRNQSKAEYYNSKYEGKEEQWTFRGGWKLGYWEGRVSALEGALDLLEDLGMKPEIDISAYFGDEFK